MDLPQPKSPDSAENLATLHRKGHPINSFYLGLDSVQHAAMHRKVFAQGRYRQNLLALGHMSLP